MGDLTITITPDERVPDLFRVVASEPASTIEATMHADILGTWINETVASWAEMLVECNTCGSTGEWETTTEESPDEFVSLGPCPDC